MIKYACLLLMLVSSYTASAAEPVFATSVETKYARELKPPSGKALIYIYQRNDAGAAVSPPIWLNNYEMGRLAPGSFTVWQLAPGQLEMRIGGTEPMKLSLRSQAGKVFLFRVSVTRTTAGTKAVLESLPEYDRMDMAQTRLLKNPRQVSEAVTTTPPVTPASTPKHTQRQVLEPGGFSLMLKAGSMTLSQDSQTIDGVTGSLDTSASGTFAAELDYQYASAVTLGAELMRYKTNMTWSGSSNDISVFVLLGNLKQYFNTHSPLQPYVGAGLGVAVTDISGATLNGNTSGFAYQLLGGVEYRTSSIGFVAEAKYLGAKTSDSEGRDIDVSGAAILAGVVFHF